MDVEHKAPTAREEPYNPFEHREVKKPNSDIRSTANLIKASLGSGLLAVPLAFSNSGWLVGILGTLIIGMICSHCVHILVKTSRACCVLDKKPLLNYAESCESAFANGPKKFRKFARTAYIVAECSMFLTYVGVCCIFTVLIADSVKQLIDRYVPGNILPVEYYCLILLVPLLFMVQIPHLKWLAPLSLLANILLVATFAICLYYIFGTGNADFSNRRMVTDISRLPAFLSTVIFAMEGIGIVMPVENVMKKPEHFLGCPSILVISMSVIVAMYSLLGLFGYLRFGDVLRGSITLNLPMDDWPAICAKVFIALSIFFTFPLQFFVVVDIFNRFVEPKVKENYRTITQIVSRSFLVFLCVGLGIAIPMLEQVINIVGAFFYTILGLFIPAIIETVFRWDDLGKFNWRLWKNAAIVMFGCICLVSGCTLAISDIIARVNSKTE